VPLLQYRRFGIYVVSVVKRPGAEESMYRGGADCGALAPDAQGVYWHDPGGSWTAMERYRNVVLEWVARQRRTDDRFRRLDAVLSRLGRPDIRLRRVTRQTRA
jgi:hypothetical protein